MNKRLIAIVLLLGILFAPDRSACQRRSMEREKVPLNLAISQFPTHIADSIQVSVFTQISLDQLVFLAYSGGFKASYEVSVFVVDKDEMVRSTRIWQEEVVKSQFEETRSGDLYHIAHTDFILSSGKYEIVANLVDLDSRQEYKANEKINITSYPPGQLAMSDILLVSEAVKSDRITPYIGNLISDQADSVYIYFTILAPIEKPSQAHLQGTVMENGDTSVAFHDTLHLGDALSTHFIPLATNNLKELEYTLTIRVEMDSLEVEQSIPIHIALKGFSHLIEDVDQAVEQARYVATNSQIREMSKLKGEAKREAFLAFWRTLDPTPDTPRNELMNEYYRRVAYANANFRSFLPGWETDMGMVYIIYGQPDDIERHPFNMDSKPYQIWYYYGKGWRFIFVDVNMLGDYRLTTPLYPGRSF